MNIISFEYSRWYRQRSELILKHKSVGVDAVGRKLFLVYCYSNLFGLCSKNFHISKFWYSSKLCAELLSVLFKFRVTLVFGLNSNKH